MALVHKTLKFSSPFFLTANLSLVESLGTLFYNKMNLLILTPHLKKNHIGACIYAQKPSATIPFKTYCDLTVPHLMKKKKSF